MNMKYLQGINIATGINKAFKKYFYKDVTYSIDILTFAAR